MNILVAIALATVLAWMINSAILFYRSL